VKCFKQFKGIRLHRARLDRPRRLVPVFRHRRRWLYRHPQEGDPASECEIVQGPNGPGWRPTSQRPGAEQGTHLAGRGCAPCAGHFNFRTESESDKKTHKRRHWHIRPLSFSLHQSGSINELGVPSKPVFGWSLWASVCCSTRVHQEVLRTSEIRGREDGSGRTGDANGM